MWIRERESLVALRRVEDREPPGSKACRGSRELKGSRRDSRGIAGWRPEDREPQSRRRAVRRAGGRKIEEAWMEAWKIGKERNERSAKKQRGLEENERKENNESKKRKGKARTSEGVTIGGRLEIFPRTLRSRGQRRYSLPYGFDGRGRFGGLSFGWGERRRGRGKGRRRWGREQGRERTYWLSLAWSGYGTSYTSNPPVHRGFRFGFESGVGPSRRARVRVEGRS